jgi:hypothetical protein
MRFVTAGLLAVSIFGSSAIGQNFVGGAGRDEHRGRKLWWLSVAAVAGAALFDVASSAGKYEANPLLRSRDGTFAGRGVAIKLGALGAGLAAQYLLFRNQPRTPNTVSFVNFAAAGALSGVAVRNLDVPKAPPATPMAPGPQPPLR